MTRPLLCISCLAISFLSHAQDDFFILQKKSKTLQRFTTGSFIIFQAGGSDWITGDITRIQHDSLDVRPRALRYSLMGIDTVHFSILHLALSDITLMPRQTAMVNYHNDKPVVIHGHEKYVYVKNGLLFQILGGGYAALNITNSLIKNDPPFAKKNRTGLYIAAAAFSIGELLHFTYKQYLKIGKKYHFKYVKLSPDTLNRHVF